MARLNFFKNPTVLIWIICLIILIPILKSGFFSIHDETHIVDVYEMIRSLQLGGFPPRFAPDFNFNIGHPYFNFYYHLPFYIASGLYFAGFSMTDSFKYMLGIAVIIAASGFYFFLRNHVSKTAAVFGTLVFILSPYFAVDLYVRGAPGEMYVLAFFPWAACFFYRYLKDFSLKYLALSSTFIFLLGISHNVLLPFVYSFLFLYGAVNLFISKVDLKNSLKIFLPFLLGVLLGAYYLLPALVEVQYISSYEQINIADHFPFLKQLIIPHWGYGPSIWGYLDDISFDIGTVNLIFLAISFFVFKTAKKEFKPLLIFFWIIFGLTIVLMNSRTLFFWESIRYLRLVQFPWRMLILTTISTAFITAIVTETVLVNYKKVSQWFLFVIFVLLISLNIWHYHPSEFKTVTDEEYLMRYFANESFESREARGVPFSEEYRNFTEDFIPPTIWQTRRPSNLLSLTFETATESSQIDYETDEISYKINYQTSVDNKIIVPKVYFPNWKVMNGKEENLEVLPYSEYGIIAVPVKSGSGSVHLKYESTQIENMANIVSAISALVILVLLVYPLRRQK